MPQLALQAPLGREQLDADVVEMDAAVHARLDVRLGADERLRAGEESADLRAHGDELAAAPQHLHGGVAQQAEAGCLDRIGGGVALGQAVLAHAEEGEIVVGDPVEEGHRLRDLVGRQRRRIGAIGVDRLGDAGPHAGPVAHRDGDVGIDLGQPLDEAPSRRLVVDAVEVDLDEALAPGADRGRRGRLADKARQGAALVAFDGEDRMRHEPRLVALLDELGEGRIEEERHVLVHDLDRRDVAPRAAALDLAVDEALIGAVVPARRAQMLVGGRGKVGEGLRRVGREVLLRHPPEERADELSRHVPPGARDERAGLVEQVALRRLRLCFCRHESLPAGILRP